MFFGGLGCQGQRTTHVQEHNCFLALPPSAARPQNHLFLENLGFCWPWYPKPPKNHVAKNKFRDPSDIGPEGGSSQCPPLGRKIPARERDFRLPGRTPPPRAGNPALGAHKPAVVRPKMKTKSWVPEGKLAGIFGGAFLKSGRPRGLRKAFKNVGGFAPHRFEGLPGLPGPARPQKCSPTNPARLLSGTQ